MELVLHPESWVLVVVTASVCSWIMGEIHGASRARIGSRLQESEMRAFFTDAVPPKVKPSEAAKPTHEEQIAPRNPNNSRPIHQPVHAEIIDEDSLAQAKRERAEFRRRVFAEMPPVCFVREQARNILQSDDVWSHPDVSERLNEFMQNADPTSLGLLRHYRESIDELQRSNSQSEIERADPDLLTELPRLSDLAPIRPDQSMIELARNMDRRQDSKMPRPRYPAVGMR